MWVISRSRGHDFPTLLANVLSIGVGLLLFVVLAGGRGQAWEAQMAGRLPGTADHMRQVHADWEATWGSQTKFVILGVYTGLVAALVYALLR